MTVKGDGKKFVYVTGCDTGFGSIVSRSLHKLGFGVFAGCYLQSSMDELIAECGGDRMVPLLLDVSKEESVTAASETLRAALSARPGAVLHGVVNNAGVLVSPGPFEWGDIASYRRMFDVNVLGTIMVTKSVVDLIRKSQGRIVNVASVAGRLGLPSQPAYCASKFAVVGFNDVIRKDMQPWGATVHLIEPGVFSKTGLYDNYQTGLDALWDNLPEHLKQEYGQKFKDHYREMLGKALMDFGNVNSNLVPEAMVHALTSSDPQYHYKVGFDSKYVIPAIASLPTAALDMALTAGEVVAPATAPKDGLAKAKARYAGGNFKYYLMAAILLLVIRKMRK